MDVHVVNAEATPARGKYTHRWVFERAGVSAAAGHAVDHGITTDDLVFDVEPEIGKRSTPGSHDRPDESTGLCAAVTEVLEVVAEEVVDGRQVPSVPQTRE